jgi:hypothetical protein
LVGDGKGAARLSTGSVVSNFCGINNGLRVVSIQENPIVETRFQVNIITNITITPIILVNGANTIKFYAANGGGGGTNWQLETSDGVGTTILNAGDVSTTDWTTVKLVITTDSVESYVNGFLTATITADIPTAFMTAGSLVSTSDSVYKTLDVSYYKLTKDSLDI